MKWVLERQIYVEMNEHYSSAMIYSFGDENGDDTFQFPMYFWLNELFVELVSSWRCTAMNSGRPTAGKPLVQREPESPLNESYPPYCSSIFQRFDYPAETQDRFAFFSSFLSRIAQLDFAVPVTHIKDVLEIIPDVRKPFDRVLWIRQMLETLRRVTFPGLMRLRSFPNEIC